MDETENESEMMNKQKLKPIFKRWTLHPLDEHQRQFEARDFIMFIMIPNYL